MGKECDICSLFRWAYFKYPCFYIISRDAYTMQHSAPVFGGVTDMAGGSRICVYGKQSIVDIPYLILPGHTYKVTFKDTNLGRWDQRGPGGRIGLVSSVLI